MKEDFRKMIIEYLEAQRLEFLYNSEIYRSITLEEFVSFMNTYKTGGWNIRDIVKCDVENYRTVLLRSRTKQREVSIQIKIIESFIDYACFKKWIDVNPLSSIGLR